VTHSEHSHSHGEHRLLGALALTGTFMVAEIIGGIMSGSLALLADAGHMLTDTAALALAWGAARLARKPADSLRSYGYHRLQIVAALVNGVAFIAVVIWIVIEATSRLLAPQPVLGGLMLGVAIAGLAVNLLAFVVLHGGKRTDLNLRAALVHVLGDLLGSVAAIAAAVVILLTGWYPIDPLLSVLVALLILRSAIYVVRHSVHILLEGAPGDLDLKTLHQTLVEAVPGVCDVHHVHVWSLTPERPLMTLHVSVAEEADHREVLNRVKSVLTDRFGIEHSTVQIEYTDHCADHHPATS
jgi:cobalt-zinc-cadmium efflux system protein